MVKVEEVAQQLRALPRGRTEAEQMMALRQACVRLSAPIIRELYRCFTGRVVLTKDQLKAGEMLLERAVPRIAQTTVKHELPGEAQNESQVVDRIAALVRQHPELVPLIDGAMGRTVVEGSAEVES